MSKSTDGSEERLVVADGEPLTPHDLPPSARRPRTRVVCSRQCRANSFKRSSMLSFITGSKVVWCGQSKHDDALAPAFYRALFGHGKNSSHFLTVIHLLLCTANDAMTVNNGSTANAQRAKPNPLLPQSIPSVCMRRNHTESCTLAQLELSV